MVLAVLLLSVFAYFLIVVAVGYFTKRYILDASDYVVSGRNLSWLVVGISLAVTHLSGTTTVGIPENAFIFGIGAFTWVWAWVIAVLVVAFVFGAFMRRSGGQTIAEWIGMYYGPKTRTTFAIPQVIGIPFAAAAQIVAAALLFTGLTGLPLWATATIVGVAALIYLWFGGLWAVSITDVIQWAIGMFGFLLAAVYILLRYGGYGFLQENLPADHLAYTHEEFPVGIVDNEWGQVTMLGLIFFFCILFWPNNYYWIRTVSARSERAFKKGYLLAAVALMIILGFIPVMFGLYGQVLFPDADPGAITAVWIENLPLFIAVPVFVMIFAAILSTADLAAIGAAAILIRDVWRPLRPDVSDDQLVQSSRLITSVLLVWVILVAIASIYSAEIGPWLTLGVMVAAFSASMPMVFASMFLPKRWAPKEAAALSILAGLTVAMYQVVFEMYLGILSGFWAEVHAMYTGFATALVVFVAIAIVRQFTGPWWGEEDRHRFTAPPRRTTGDFDSPSGAAQQRTESTGRNRLSTSSTITVVSVGKHIADVGWTRPGKRLELAIKNSLKKR